MGTEYTRQSSFTDGDTITANLFNDEYNQLLAAFATDGHSHDGTAAEGGAITKLLGTAITIGTNGVDVAVTFDGGSNDGLLTWMEDEDYFQFSDDLLLTTTEKVQFRDTAIYINSSADGQLDIVADTEIQIAATTIDMNGAVDISGNLGVGGNLTVTGTTTFNGGTLTLGDAASDNVVFGADVNSSIIPNGANGSFDLGSSGQEWRDLFINGTAHIDTLDIDENATITGTLGVTGIATFTDDIIIGDGKTIGSASDVDAITIAANGQLTLTQTLIGTALDISGDIDIDGTTNLDVVDIDGAVNMATTALVTGVLTTTATQVATGGITSGSNIVSDTDSTDDLGTTSVRWANLFVDGITATDQITATGFTGTLDGILGSGTAAAATVTSLDTSAAVNLNLATDSTSSTSGALIVDGGVGIAKKLFVGTDLDVDGTANLDVVDIDGAVDMASTLAVTGKITADAGIDIDNFNIDGTTIALSSGNLDVDVAGNVTIDADGGTITFADAGSSLGTITSSGYSGTSAVATTVTITDNESTNENNALVFTAGGDLDGGNLGLESDGDLKYNPSTGTLSATNISVTGTLSTVDSVTMSANNAVVFEGATADAHETTLTVVDATADRTITLPNQSGTVPVLAATSNTAVTSTPEELNALDGITAVVGELNALDIGSTAVGTAVASKAVILDSNKDYTGLRNFTVTGELDAATLDLSGNADVAGTLTQTGVATFTAKSISNAGVSVKNGATSAGFVEFFEDSDNGTNKVTLIGPASTADVTLTLPSAAGIISTIDDATALAIALG